MDDDRSVDADIEFAKSFVDAIKAIGLLFVGELVGLSVITEGIPRSRALLLLLAIALNALSVLLAYSYLLNVSGSAR